jgi:hypothetical protein
MNEKENVKTNEQETTPHAKKQLKRYTTENKKDPAKLKETEAGPRESRGKNKEDDNSNLPPTEDKRPSLNSH